MIKELLDNIFNVLNKIYPNSDNFRWIIGQQSLAPSKFTGDFGFFWFDEIDMKGIPYETTKYNSETDKMDINVNAKTKLTLIVEVISGKNDGTSNLAFEIMSQIQASFYRDDINDELYSKGLGLIQYGNLINLSSAVSGTYDSRYRCSFIFDFMNSVAYNIDRVNIIDLKLKANNIEENINLKTES